MVQDSESEEEEEIEEETKTEECLFGGKNRQINENDEFWIAPARDKPTANAALIKRGIDPKRLRIGEHGPKLRELISKNQVFL